MERILELFCGAVPPALLTVGLYFGVRLRFFPFFHPIATAKRMLSRGAGKEGSLRATAMALAGTVGVGNMAGVAVALLSGGAGAVFWMWVSALAAMLLKYAEITLALDSRTPDGLGGTPASFIKAGLVRVGKFFALLCLFNSFLLGGAVQSGAVRDAFADSFGTPPLAVALLLVLVTLPPLFGGGKRIASLTARLVPFMCIFYLVAACLVIGFHAAALPDAVCRIFRDAFSPDAATGGILGFLTSRGLREGVARGLMSNEGGCGTAPLAHATASPRHPADQGIFGILEVGVDTLVICTLTALALLTAFPDLPEGLSAMALVRAAFSSALGEIGGHAVALALFFFAYATLLCQGFYGEAALAFLTKNRIARTLFRLIFLASVALGALAPTDRIFLVTDALLAILTLTNLALLFARSGRIVALTREAGLLPPKRRIQDPSLPMKSPPQR